MTEMTREEYKQKCIEIADPPVVCRFCNHIRHFRPENDWILLCHCCQNCGVNKQTTSCDCCTCWWWNGTATCMPPCPQAEK